MINIDNESELTQDIHISFYFHKKNKAQPLFFINFIIKISVIIKFSPKTKENKMKKIMWILQKNGPLKKNDSS